jgi:hypothetical protein
VGSINATCFSPLADPRRQLGVLRRSINVVASRLSHHRGHRVRTLDEVEADSVRGPVFSDRAKLAAWIKAWCARCVHDASARDDSVKPDPRNHGLTGCPILAVAMLNRTPAEITAGEGDRRCSMFLLDAGVGI